MPGPVVLVVMLSLAQPVVAADPAGSERRMALAEKVVAATRLLDLEEAAVAGTLQELQEPSCREGRRVNEFSRRLGRPEERAWWVAMLSRELSEEELQSILTLMQSKAGTAFAAVQVSAMREAVGHLALDLSSPDQRLQRERADTMDRIRMLATALEARATDTNQYPAKADGNELRTLLEPTYILHAPLRDAWGHEFLFIGSEDQQNYRFVSAGADGVFERRSQERHEDGDGVRLTDDPNDDIIFENGMFLQAPRELAQEGEERERATNFLPPQGDPPPPPPPPD